MKRKLVNDPPVDHITLLEILATSQPLIAFTGPPGTGFLIPCRYQGCISVNSANEQYMARSVINFGGGNGWLEPDLNDKDVPRRKTLNEWIGWLSERSSFDVFVFDSEKELFTWLADHCA